MGWFGGGGGGAPAKKKDAPKNAILQLRGTLEMLNKREKHLQNQIDDQDGMARKYVNTNKAQAKAALRRKKQFEHSMEQTQAQMATVEREIGSIETANINKETLDAMANASKAMKQIHGGLTIDKVDNTMYVLLLVLAMLTVVFSLQGLKLNTDTCCASQGRPSRTTRYRRGNRRSTHTRRDRAKCYGRGRS